MLKQIHLFAALGFRGPVADRFAVYKFRGDLGKEWRGVAGQAPAIEEAAPGVQEKKLILRPRHGHIEKPSFLLNVGVLLIGSEGDEPLLHACDEDDFEFKALSHVHGHEGNSISPRIEGICSGEEAQFINNL